MEGAAPPGRGCSPGGSIVAGDPTLAELLDKMRDIMLTHEARFDINMPDVPEGEKHRGKDWRDSLLKAGVPKNLPKFQAGLKRLSVDMKPDEPEPEVPPLRVGDPVPPAWKPKRVGRPAGPSVGPGTGMVGWAREQPVAAGAAGFGALFATGWALSIVYKRKSGRCSSLKVENCGGRSHPHHTQSRQGTSRRRHRTVERKCPRRLVPIPGSLNSARPVLCCEADNPYRSRRSGCKCPRAR
mgnify:CR=1 FL=1